MTKSKQKFEIWTLVSLVLNYPSPAPQYADAIGAVADATGSFMG